MTPLALLVLTVVTSLCSLFLVICAWRSTVNIVPLLLALITGCFFCWTFVTGMLAFATARARFAHWSPTSCCSALLSAVRMNAVQAVRYFRRSFKNLCCSATASLWQVRFFAFSRVRSASSCSSCNNAMSWMPTTSWSRIFRPSCHDSCNFWPVCRAP